MRTAVGQLAWAEGRRLLRNPLLWLSMAVVIQWYRAADRPGGTEDQLFLLVGYGLLLPGFVMVMITVFAVLRARLERTEPLLTTLAVGPDRRSIGHVWSALAGGAVGAAVVAAIAVALPARDPLGVWNNEEGGAIVVPRPSIAQLLQGPLSIVAVLVFVVALVRWIPTWLVILPLGFLLMVQGLFMGVFHGVPKDSERWLFPLNTGVVNSEWFGGCLENTPCYIRVSGFDRSTPWWHLGYLASLCVWLATIAVMRHRRDRVTWAWQFVSLVAVLTFAAVQFATADAYPN